MNKNIGEGGIKMSINWDFVPLQMLLEGIILTGGIVMEKKKMQQLQIWDEEARMEENENSRLLCLAILLSEEGLLNESKVESIMMTKVKGDYNHE